MCDVEGCSEAISNADWRWGCARCNFDMCTACEPTQAAAVQAARDAICKAAAAKVAAAAVASVLAVARGARSDRAVRLQLHPDYTLRFAPDWGGKTRCIEMKPPDNKPGIHVLRRRLAAETKRADDAKAEIARRVAAEKESARQQARKAAGRELQAASMMSPPRKREVSQLLSPKTGCDEKAKRRHAEKRARDAEVKMAAVEAKLKEQRRVRVQAEVSKRKRAQREVRELKAEMKEALAKTAAAEAATAAANDEAKAVKAVAKAEVAEVKAAAKAEVAEVRAAARAEVRAVKVETKAEVKAAKLAATAAKAEAAKAIEDKDKAVTEAEKAQTALETLKERLNLYSDRKQVPGSSDRRRGLPFLQAALEDRSAEDVATALKLTGGSDFLLELGKTKEFQHLIKATVEDTVKTIQDRWAPRLAVLIMSDLQLSRSQFDALRHYLSFTYDVDDDVYRALKLYVNPHKPNDVVHMAKLASRYPREAEQDQLFGLCGVESSDDGMVSYIKDQRGAISSMVADRWESVSSDVKEGQRPLLLCAFGDATGGWRGSSITHFELGVGSWDSEADAQIKQGSKATLLPVALGEGDDGAENLRLRFEKLTDGFNDLASGAPLKVNLLSGPPRDVPTEFTFCGDFQIIKAILGMSKYTSAIWCLCDHDGTGMYRARLDPAASWAEVLAWFIDIGCEVKTEEKVSALNHYSHEVLMGRPFKRFKCSQPGCGYVAESEAAWRADMAAHAHRPIKERRLAEREHGRIHKRHRPWMKPLLKLPPIRISADMLHLVYINLFVMYLESTVLCYVVEFDEIGRQPVEVYLASHGIPMKIVKAQNVGEMKDSLTGRDAKVMMDKAEEILPELLLFAHADNAEVAATATAMAAEVEQEQEQPQRRGTLDDDVFDLPNPDENDGDGDGDGGGAAGGRLEAAVARCLARTRVERHKGSQASPERRAAIAALIQKHRRCSDEELTELLDADTSFLAITLAGTLIGFAAYRHETKEEGSDGERVCYVRELHIDSTHQGARLGTALMDEVELLAVEAGLPRVVLTVLISNRRGRRFYARRGYWIDVTSPPPSEQENILIFSRAAVWRDPDIETTAERDARFWDGLYGVRRALRPFERDDDPYRQDRAVELFNASTTVMKDIKVLRPSLQSACPHVLAHIATRQIVEMGDPLRRGCDQSESIGANMKSTIHRRVLRRTITGKETTHHRRDRHGKITKTWTQHAIRVSRVMQAFKAECVRERILRDPKSAPWLQRHHHRLLNSGRVSKAWAKEKGPEREGSEISEAYVKRLRIAREEGGEPEVCMDV